MSREVPLESLDHVIIAVRDLAAATGATTRLLGRAPSWRGEHPGEGSVNTLFRLENTTIELLAPEGDGPTGDALRARLAALGEGLVGLAFGTASAERAREEFVGAGLSPEKIVKGLGRDVESGAFRSWRRAPLPLEHTRGVLLFAIEHESPPDILPVAASIGDPRAAVTGLDHVVVRTSEGDACRRLYGEGLGLRVALDKSFEQWGARLIFCRIGGLTVEIAASLPAGKREGGEGDDDREAEPAASGRDALWGLSFRVADAARARERLHGAGFAVDEPRDGRKPGTRVFTVHDAPCGVATLMLEPPLEPPLR